MCAGFAQQEAARSARGAVSPILLAHRGVNVWCEWSEVSVNPTPHTLNRVSKTLSRDGAVPGVLEPLNPTSEPSTQLGTQLVPRAAPSAPSCLRVDGSACDVI